MNYLVIPVVLLIAAGLTYLAKLTLERLDTKILPFYEFNLSLPSSGRWSVIFFIIIISLLTLVVLFSTGQDIPLRPA